MTEIRHLSHSERAVSIEIYSYQLYYKVAYRLKNMMIENIYWFYSSIFIKKKQLLILLLLFIKIHHN